MTLVTLALLIGAFPFLDRQINLLWINTLIPILVFTLLALGLNIVVGYAGLLDLGYAAFLRSAPTLPVCSRPATSAISFNTATR